MHSNNYNHPTYDGNFLRSFIYKILSEYKALLNNVRNTKPFKIIEITQLSTIPGETEFLVQISNKNSAFYIKASDIFCQGLNLNNFSHFHAEMIRQAAKGKLNEYLNDPEIRQSKCKIISKKVDRGSQQFEFTIGYLDNLQFKCTAEEVYKSKHLLKELDSDDAYDIGFTHGCESIINENKQLKSIKTSR